ncbi:hypothetical protein Emed_006325 [Eimeria media]
MRLAWGAPQGAPQKGGPGGPPMSPVEAPRQYYKGVKGFVRMAGATQTLEEELRGAETYEDYLDSFITDNERMYLKEVGENTKIERNGLKGFCVLLMPQHLRMSATGTVLSREAFYAKAEALDQQQKAAKRGGGGAPRYVSGGGGAPQLPAGASALGRQLSAREELIRCGSLSTVVFDLNNAAAADAAAAIAAAAAEAALSRRSSKEKETLQLVRIDCGVSQRLAKNQLKRNACSSSSSSSSESNRGGNSRRNKSSSRSSSNSSSSSSSWRSSNVLSSKRSGRKTQHCKGCLIEHASACASTAPTATATTSTTTQH